MNSKWSLFSELVTYENSLVVLCSWSWILSLSSAPFSLQDACRHRGMYSFSQCRQKTRSENTGLTICSASSHSSLALQHLASPQKLNCQNGGNFQEVSRKCCSVTHPHLLRGIFNCSVCKKDIAAAFVWRLKSVVNVCKRLRYAASKLSNGVKDRSRMFTWGTDKTITTEISFLQYTLRS